MNDSHRAATKIENLPATLSVEEAAQLCRIGRNAAYRAAHRGELPIFRLGRQLRVPTVALLRMLGVNDESPDTAS